MIRGVGVWVGNAGRGGPKCGATGYPLIGGHGYYGVGYGYQQLVAEMVYPYVNPARPLDEVELRAQNNVTVLAARAPISVCSYAFPIDDLGLTQPCLWGYNCKAGDFVQIQVNVQDSGWSAGAPRFAVGAYSVEIPLSGVTIGDLIHWHEDDDGNTVWTLRDQDTNTIRAQGPLSTEIVWAPPLGPNMITIAGDNGGGKVTTLETYIDAQDNM